MDFDAEIFEMDATLSIVFKLRPAELKNYPEIICVLIHFPSILQRLRLLSASGIFSFCPRKIPSISFSMSFDGLLVNHIGSQQCNLRKNCHHLFYIRIIRRNVSALENSDIVICSVQSVF